MESNFKKDGPVPLFSVETFFYIFSILYGGAMAIRARLYEKGVIPSKTLPCRVVSIGNIVAGGAGKTPMTIFMAKTLRDMGYRVVVISRGYRGKMEKTGGIVSDGETIFKGPDDAGDEPFLMARLLQGIPVVVGCRRYEAGKKAIEFFHPDVIILDDAFQHLRLSRDANLLLLHHRSPLGNGHILPRGPLREPLSALRRAQAIILTRRQENEDPPDTSRLPASIPVFQTCHIPIVRTVTGKTTSFLQHIENINVLNGKKTVAFAGLADNGQFFNVLKDVGCILTHTISYGDHHRYRFEDMDEINEIFKSSGSEFVVTTLKDFVKFDGKHPLSKKVIVTDIQIHFSGNPVEFLAHLFL